MFSTAKEAVQLTKRVFVISIFGRAMPTTIDRLLPRLWMLEKVQWSIAKKLPSVLL